jgi:hypothetical protein
MAWLKEVWGSWFQDPSVVDGRDIDRIREMLEYLRDEPYVPAPGRRG